MTTAANPYANLSRAEKIDLLLLLEEKLKRQARGDFLEFVKYTKDDFKVNWHHKLIADKLNAFAKGEIKHLMIFAPPRHGKSELVSRRFPAYLHGVFPNAEIMAVSYLDSLAGDMTVDVQNIIDSGQFQDLFPNTKIWPWGTKYTLGTRNTTEHHIVGMKGKYRGQGVGGSFTGKGANFIIIDDPIKGREVADSEAFRERLWEFYNNDLFTRLETNLETGAKGQVLITQTRWTNDDLSSRLLDLMKTVPGAVQWEVLSLPAIRTDLDSDYDPRALGEPLWPQKYDLKQLDEIRASSGVRAWSSLYQQNPIPDGGMIFKDEMFDNVEMPSAFDYKFITADTAYNDKRSNDFTVFTAFGVLKGELFVIDVWREQIKAADVEARVIPFIRKFSDYGFRGAYIEPKGHGIYLNQVLPQKGLILPSESQRKEFYADRRFDKVQRANNAVPHLSNRKVHFNKHMANLETLMAEVLNFPSAKHDDFADCLIDGIKFTFARQVGILDVL